MAERKKFQELQFSDAFMFAAAMEDEEVCRGVLERALGIPVKAVRVRSEYSLLVNSDYRGVRMDVYADDEAGTIFDCEMQTTSKRDLPRRSRYYQAQMDSKSVKPSEDVLILPDSFIIFICKFDPFGQGLYRYSFRARCDETNEEIGDGACRIFLNTQGTVRDGVPPELIRFLEYVENADADAEQPDPLVEMLESRIDDLKHDRAMEVAYMQFEEMLRDERAEGREEGKAEGLEEGLEKGRVEGRTEGKDEGHQDILELIGRMTADGKASEIPRLSTDSEFCEEMLEKYHIGS